MTTETHGKILFRCKTDNAFHIKIMTEITANVLKTSFWEIGPNGISLSMFDDARKTMITIDLYSYNFQFYDFELGESINIGVNSTHFHKMLKSIKKKDTLELQIDSHDSNELKITTIPQQHNRTTVSQIKIQTVQNLEVMNPGGYGKSVIIQSTDFKKMIKDLGALNSEKICIRTLHGQIHFTADADGIMKRTVTFGEENKKDTAESSDCFSTEQIQRISKISALCESIHVYPSSKYLPVQFRTNVGLLGTMCIYIKSDENISRENE